MAYGICTCSKHNYSGTSLICPDCARENEINDGIIVSLKTVIKFMKEDMDIEHRRRVAAEAIIKRLPLSNTNHYCPDLYEVWQSIIKEAGE